MKKLSLFLISVLLLSLSACSLQKNQKDFSALREIFLERGNEIEGYEVTEIEEYDGFDYFCVRISLNADENVAPQDYVWYDADVMLFDSLEEADRAYEENQQSGVGGVCIRHENILMYWLKADPFADFYREVFDLAFYKDSEN